MNLKRMADQYRDQLMATGIRAREEVAEVVAVPEYYRHIGYAQAYLHGWYVKLSKAHGSEKGLEDLKMSWTTLVELNRLTRPYHRRHENVPVEMYDQVLELARKAQGYLEQFLKKLPLVTEECLTYAVQTSGIQLK